MLVSTCIFLSVFTNVVRATGRGVFQVANDEPSLVACGGFICSVCEESGEGLYV